MDKEYLLISVDDLKKYYPDIFVNEGDITARIRDNRIDIISEGKSESKEDLYKSYNMTFTKHGVILNSGDAKRLSLSDRDLVNIERISNNNESSF